MKRVYYKALFRSYTEPVEGYQEIEGGNVTGYFMLDGKPLEAFVSCALVEESKAPTWAADISVSSENISDVLDSALALLDSNKCELLTEKIKALIDEANSA